MGHAAVAQFGGGPAELLLEAPAEGLNGLLPRRVAGRLFRDEPSSGRVAVEHAVG